MRHRPKITQQVSGVQGRSVRPRILGSVSTATFWEAVRRGE